MENEKKISVYVKTDENKNIIEVASSIFLKDTTGWQKINEGFGDRFAHAQSQYLDLPLKKEDGSYNYQLK